MKQKQVGGGETLQVQIGGDEPKKKRSKTAAKKQRKKPPWSKLMMVVIIAICVEIVIYSEIAMWAKDNFDALYVLLGIPAAMFGVFWSYTEKSKVENSAGGITYETAMMELGTRESERTPEDTVG
ncbi:MAG: hypothetical protein LUI87_02365 [Lachnospiraceae bacterium]|nr:hypothetical protein [Lachnospiraceae bacterium]